MTSLMLKTLTIMQLGPMASLKTCSVGLQILLEGLEDCAERLHPNAPLKYVDMTWAGHIGKWSMINMTLIGLLSTP